jgi:hypothetical protein
MCSRVAETPEFRIKNEIAKSHSFTQLQKISGDILFKSLVGRIGCMYCCRQRAETPKFSAEKRDKKFGNDGEERVRLVR